MRGMVAPVFSFVTFWIGIFTCAAVCIERAMGRRKSNLDRFIYALNPRGVLARPEKQGKSITGIPLRPTLVLSLSPTRQMPFSKRSRQPPSLGDDVDNTVARLSMDTE